MIYKIGQPNGLPFVLYSEFISYNYCNRHLGLQLLSLGAIVSVSSCGALGGLSLTFGISISLASPIRQRVILDA